MGPYVVLRCWVSGAEAVSVINELVGCVGETGGKIEKVDQLELQHFFFPDVTNVCFKICSIIWLIHSLSYANTFFFFPGYVVN